MSNTVIQGYVAAAEVLISQYEAISPASLYSAVVDYFPTNPSTVLDIGAGIGRDAAWLAGQGHAVLAVEPVPAFREAGQQAYGEDGITWLDDTLPLLTASLALGQKFDLILMSAVLHHLPEAQRRLALKQTVQMLAEGGRVILSLRHGPFAASRPAYPAKASDVISAAKACGLKMNFQNKIGSIQARNTISGVTWTWLVFSHQS